MSECQVIRLFLDGLIDLLKESKNDTVINRYLSENENSLLKSIGYYSGVDNALETLEDVTVRIFEEDNLFIFTPNS